MPPFRAGGGHFGAVNEHNRVMGIMQKGAKQTFFGQPMNACL